MIHIGIDHHKRYSHAVAITDSGTVCWDGRLSSTLEAFRSLREALPSSEPVQCVLEAGRNWGILYDALEAMGMNPKLADPLKMRIIAETFTKTDRIDATTHAIVLKAGLTPLVHVPPKAVRDQKNILRRRFWLVQLQTSIKNRIHNILDRNHLEPPECSDLFGRRGRAWMNALSLPDPDGKLLPGDLELLDETKAHVRQTEQWIDEALQENAIIPILMTLPGVGKLLAALIALEIHTSERFPSAGKFCAYAGLACSTYSSGGKTFHGGLIPRCNHHLRYAFVEAAWTAVRTSPYFQAYHRRLKVKIGGQKAIAAVARRLCEISYHCLKRGKAYEERPYRFGSGSQARCAQAVAMA